MKVQKRNGQLQDISFDKILNRIKDVSTDLNIDIDNIAQKTIQGMYDSIKTQELDELAASIAIDYSLKHPDYAKLASRIIISNHQKNTNSSIIYTFTLLFENSLISEKTYNFVKKYQKDLQLIVDYKRDFLIDYFGFKTLEKSYLIKLNGKIIERPQHMWLRVACGIHDTLQEVAETYYLTSNKYFTHASPTLFNAGTNRPQLSSCFLMGTDDSIEGIFKTITDTAKISKWAGGIGLHVSNIRARGSKITGTNGTGTGIIPMLKVYNDVAEYINQGSKRKGSFAIYLEPWHADILDFLKIKRSHGDEKMRTRDLFYSVFLNDLFMKRIKTNEPWSLMCPFECPGLTDVYGDEFEKLYTEYESKGMYKCQISPREIWKEIIISQIETGMPYLLNKKAMNEKSNQKHYGTIKSSNLCVAPETPILTDNGYIPISDLEDMSVNVWNGNQFSKTVVKKTSDSSKLVKVVTNCGQELECTEYHKFYTQDTKHKIKRAHELEPGDKLIKFDLPVIQGTQTLHKPYGKFFVPLNGYKIKDRLDWLAEFVDSVGIIVNDSLQICSIEKEFLKKIQLMLQTLGVTSKITKYTDRLLVSSCGLYKLTQLGFKCLRLKWVNRKPQRNAEQFIKVRQVIDEGREDETYCFTEPLRSMGMFGGILTGNCGEIALYSDEKEYAVCTLASIALPMFIRDGKIDHESLFDVTRVITRNLNKVIDVNYYPVPETEYSNKKHRPIGIGVQGLADVFALLKLPYGLDESKKINREIFETIYYASMYESNKLAKKYGPYDSFEGSPISKGIFQFDMWSHGNDQLSGRWDWNSLRKSIIEHGVYNSEVTALMPTASTSQILGFNECFEPFVSNMYKRRTMAGEFIVINKHLIKTLIDIGLWDEKMKNDIILHNGNISEIDNIPNDIRELYRTAWEMSQKRIIDLAYERAPFVSQTQSMNLFIKEPNYVILNSMHRYSYSKGLKTMQYYLRTVPKVNAIKITHNSTPIEDEDECILCSS